MVMRRPENVGPGVEATLLAQLGPNSDNRKLGGVATFAVSFAPGARLEIPGEDEVAPDVTLYGVTEGELEITLFEGTGFFVNPDPDHPDEDVEQPMEIGVPVTVRAGGYASLQSKHGTHNPGGDGKATVTTQGGRCKMCPGRHP